MIRFKVELRLLICMIMAVLLVAERTAVSEDGSTNSIDGEQLAIGPMVGSVDATPENRVGDAPSATKSPRGVHVDDLADLARLHADQTVDPLRGENMKEEKDDALPNMHALDASLVVTPELVAAIMAAMKGKSAPVHAGAAVNGEPSLKDDAPIPGRSNAARGHGEEDSPPTCVGGKCKNNDKSDNVHGADEAHARTTENAAGNNAAGGAPSAKPVPYIVYDDRVDIVGIAPSKTICDTVCTVEVLTYSGVRTKYALNKCLCKDRTLVRDYGVRMERINYLNDEIINRQTNGTARAKGVLVKEPTGGYELFEALVIDDLEVGMFCIEALMVIFIYYHPVWYMPIAGLAVSTCFIFITLNTADNYMTVLLIHFAVLSVHTMALRGAKEAQDVVAGLFVLVNCVLAITITGLVLYKDSLNILTTAVAINTVALGFTALSMVTSKSINAGSVCFMAVVMGRALPIMSNQMVGSISAISTIPESRDCLQFFLTQLFISLYGGRRLHWTTSADIASELNNLRLAVPQCVWIWWTASATTREAFDSKVNLLFSFLEGFVWLLRFLGVFAFRLVSTKGKWVGMWGRTDIPLHRRGGSAQFLYETRGFFLTIVCPEIPSSMGDAYGLVFALSYLSYMSALVDLLVFAFLMITLTSLVIMVQCRWLYDYDMILIGKQKDKKKKKKTFVMTPVVNQLDDGGEIVIEESDTMNAMHVIPQVLEHELVATIEKGFEQHASGGSVTPGADFTRLNSSDVVITTKLGTCHAFKEGVYTLLTVAHAFIKTHVKGLDDLPIEDFTIDIEGKPATPCKVEICHVNSTGSDALIRLTFADRVFKPVKGGFLPINPIDGGKTYLNWIMPRDGSYGQNMAERVDLAGYDCPILAYEFFTEKRDSGRLVAGLAMPYGMHAVGLHLGYCPCLARNVAIPLAGGDWRVLCGETTAPTVNAGGRSLEEWMKAIEARLPDNPLLTTQAEPLIEFLEEEIKKRVELKRAADKAKPKVKKEPVTKSVTKVAAVSNTTVAPAQKEVKVVYAKGGIVVPQMQQFDFPGPDAETAAAMKVAKAYYRKQKKHRRRVRKRVLASSSDAE